MRKITEIYAFIAEEDGSDDEGLTAMKLGRSWMPLVAADIQRVDSLRSMAKEIAEISGKPVHLVKFSQREEIEVIEP